MKKQAFQNPFPTAGRDQLENLKRVNQERYHHPWWWWLDRWVESHIWWLVAIATTAGVVAVAHHWMTFQ